MAKKKYCYLKFFGTAFRFTNDEGIMVKDGESGVLAVADPNWNLEDWNLVDAEPKMCCRGFHVTALDGVPIWKREYVALAEIGGKKILDRSTRKACAEKARVISAVFSIKQIELEYEGPATDPLVDKIVAHFKSVEPRYTIYRSMHHGSRKNAELRQS